jgi:hypothetical protein
MENNQYEPASYIADNSQMDAFRAGVESQQQIGREAYEQNEKALREMREHMQKVADFMRDPNACDSNDPVIRDLLAKRSMALASALRGIK